MITIILSYIDKDFAGKLMKHIYKELITVDPLKQAPRKSFYFFKPISHSLATYNENNLKWYTGLLQCIFQYHPDNIVREWDKLETIMVALWLEWENQPFSEIALDILYNLLLCLCHTHIDHSQFVKKQNGNYKTLEVEWQPMS